MVFDLSLPAAFDKRSQRLLRCCFDIHYTVAGGMSMSSFAKSCSTKRMPAEVRAIGTGRLSPMACRCSHVLLVMCCNDVHEPVQIISIASVTLAHVPALLTREQTDHLACTLDPCGTTPSQMPHSKSCGSCHGGRNVKADDHWPATTCCDGQVPSIRRPLHPNIVGQGV